MSFLDQYLKGQTLDDLRGSVVNRLKDIESSLNVQLGGNDTTDTFTDVIKDYVPQIMDIVTRLKTNFANWKLSTGQVVSSFKFVLGIAGEVSQIVHDLQDKIVPAGTEATKAHDLKVKFGQELTYFVYCLWDPRLVKWVPVGIESFAEKKIVMWLSGMAVDYSLTFFEQHKLFSKTFRKCV